MRRIGEWESGRKGDLQYKTRTIVRLKILFILFFTVFETIVSAQVKIRSGEI